MTVNWYCESLSKVSFLFPKYVRRIILENIVNYYQKVLNNVVKSETLPLALYELLSHDLKTKFYKSCFARF